MAMDGKGMYGKKGKTTGLIIAKWCYHEADEKRRKGRATGKSQGKVEVKSEERQGKVRRKSGESTQTAM